MMDKQKLVRIFDRQAKTYASKKEQPVQQRLRRNLIGHATGDVLELAVGTGANFPFYPREVRITAADFSGAMIERARKAAIRHQLNADFTCEDIENLNFPDHSFDTIVSTLSFCSYNNPLEMLDKLNRWCKPDGTILLMEHGISSNFLVSTAQKALNPLIYRIYGCHQTRDIMGLIRESGICIDRVESYSLNMVHLIWARPQLQL